MLDITELELAEEHLKLAKTLFSLRQQQECYDRIYGPGSYQQALAELRASLNPTSGAER